MRNYESPVESHIMDVDDFFKKWTKGKLKLNTAFFEAEIEVKAFATSFFIEKLKQFDLYSLPISHEYLISLGYSQNTVGEYCPPYPASAATYRVGLQATRFVGERPVEGTEEWRAYLTFANLPTIRRFKTLGELNYFHKGMCGSWLF